MRMCCFVHYPARSMLQDKLYQGIYYDNMDIYINIVILYIKIYITLCILYDCIYDESVFRSVFMLVVMILTKYLYINYNKNIKNILCICIHIILLAIVSCRT